MLPKNQTAVCNFIRAILADATRAGIKVTARPDIQERKKKGVEELWASELHRFAIEHTLVESFPGQTEDGAKFKKLIVPVEALLAGRLPGTFVLQVPAGASAATRFRYETVHRLLCDAIVEAAPRLEVRKGVRLALGDLPLDLTLYKRDATGSRLMTTRTVVENELEPGRVERIRTAIAEKSPKLLVACVDGRLSILALESNDISLGRYDLIATAVREALKDATQVPRIVIVIETDGGPFYAWVVHNSSDIPMKHYYDEMTVRASSLVD